MPEKNIIIVGGGIAGLACARQLATLGHDFILITKDIGGKLATSPDGSVNYAALFLPENYYHVRQFAKLGRRFRPDQAQYHSAEEAYSFWRALKHPIQLARLYSACRKFRQRLEAFRVNCSTMGQKEALEGQPDLLDLYQQPAEKWIAQRGVEEIVRDIFNPGINLCMFESADRLNAFEFLYLCLHAFIPVYEFTFSVDEFISPFAGWIRQDEVIAIKRGTPHVITTRSGEEYQATDLVLAIPATAAQPFLGWRDMKRSNNINVFNLSGQLRPEWGGGRYHLFTGESEFVGLAPQLNGTYLVGSKNHHPDFNRLFTVYSMISQKNWRPAMFLYDPIILDPKIEPGLLYIGEHNISGLEDAFIAGEFAANYIHTQRQGGDSSPNPRTQ